MSDKYEVGYRKPPKHTRFKKGQSGNPKGRTKGTKNLKTDLAEELAERITVTEGGAPRAISKQRALIKSLTAKGINGDVRAGNLIVSIIERLLLPEESDQDGRPISAEEDMILDLLLERHKDSDETGDKP